MLLDTSFVIDLLHGRESAVERIKSLEAEAIATNITTPSIFELFVGITLSKKPASEKKRIMDAIASWGTFPLDMKSAQIAGRVQGQLIGEGSMIDPEDAMIAGIAINNGETILTRNVKHFQRIPEVIVETY